MGITKILFAFLKLLRKSKHSTFHIFYAGPYHIPLVS